MSRFALTFGKPGARVIRASLKRARASVHPGIARVRTWRASVNAAARALARNQAIEHAWQTLGRALVVCALLGVAFVLFAVACIAAGAYRGLTGPPSTVVRRPAPVDLTPSAGMLPKADKPPSHVQPASRVNAHLSI